MWTLLLLLRWLSSLSQAQPPPTRHALIIGVDDYTDPDIIDLRYAARDAREVARTLIESGAYPTDHVVVMTADHPNPALRPTRTHILEQLRGLQQQAGAGGLLFYFSGHGYRVDIDGQPQNVLLPMDTSLRVPALTAIPVREVLSQLDASGVEQRLAVFDACRKDLAASRSAGSGEAWVLPVYQGEGTTALFCTRDGEVSYELEHEQLGACTATVVRGLRGAADVGRDGVVGARELYLYLDDQLGALDLPSPQRPTMSGEIAGPDLAVAPVPAPVEGPAAVCPSDRFTAAEAVRAALDRCADDEQALLAAWRQARSLVLCLGEPVTPTLAVDLYRLEAQVSRRVQDSASAVAWLRAAHEAMPEQDLRVSLDERCWMAVEEALAMSAPDSRSSPLTPPRGVRYLQDGRSAQLRLEDRPVLGQAVNPDGTVQWTRTLLPGERLPPMALPSPVMTRRKHGKQVLWGALGGAMVGGALVGAGVIARGQLSTCEWDEPDCIDGLYASREAINTVGYVGQGVLGLAIGAGGVGLWMSR